MLNKNMNNDFMPGGILCKMPEDMLTLIQNKSIELERLTLPDIINEGYRQWNILVPPIPISDPWTEEEKEYNATLVAVKGLEPVIDFFSNIVNSVFRFRISILEHDKEILNHNGHRYPRIHIPLSKTDSTFYIKHNNVIKPVILEYGNAYVINVTYTHGAKINNNQGQRRNSFFSFDHFKDPELNKKFDINKL